MNAEETSPSVIVLIPVYNDWPSVTLLIQHLDEELQRAEITARILLINDGSTVKLAGEFGALRLHRIGGIDVLNLRRNLGHQRALAIGLTYVAENLEGRAIVVMDGDGEDKPADVPRLLKKFDEEKGEYVVFAERTRRSEKIVFRFFYHLYRIAHLIMTGERVRVGNFSVLSFEHARRLVIVSDLWNHYAAAVFKVRMPITMIPSQRGTRYCGESRMNFVSLVIHGLSAMSVFGDRIGVRLLVLSMVSTLVMSLAFLATILIRLFTNLAIPGWATYTCGLLLVTTLQLMLISLVFVMVILAGRDSSSFLPLRDYAYYVENCCKVV